MVRLVRLVRLCRTTLQRRHELLVESEVIHLFRLGVLDEDEALDKIQKNRILNKQSKLGTELSDTITREVIVGVFFVLCLVSLLTYHDSDGSEAYAAEYLQSFNLRRDDINALALAANQTVDLMDRYNNGKPHLLMLLLQPGDMMVYERDLSSYRTGELSVEYVADGEYSVEAIYSHKAILQRTAGYGLLLTTFVAAILAVGIISFNADAHDLVLAPIERMMDIIEYMALDPLQVRCQNLKSNDNDGRSGEYEMKLLETAITKITGLLRVGFGIAGAEIISKNLRIDGSSSSMLDPMIPGRRVYAIYGFCDIHRFEHITECLHGEVMLFVNSVAAIVHSSTSAWAGQCNKNLGNAFVITWRIGETEEVLRLTEWARIDARRGNGGAASRRRDPPALTSLSSSMALGGGGGHSASGTAAAAAAGAGGSDAAAGRTSAMRHQSVHLLRVPGVDVLADKALIAFLKVICEINTRPSMLAYERHERLASMPGGFKLQMGFGLHTGWAIEGAVGSAQKVDATYL
ncbi:unnamed protein product, partial [Phaeothamnion confervicola]